MEIYRNRETTVTFRAPVADASYSVVVKSPAHESQVGNLPIEENFATGTHVINIPVSFQHTWYDGEIEFKITVTSGSNPQHTYSEYAEVVTPLFTKSDLPMEFSQSDTVELERLIRHIIEKFTAQTFGRYRKRISVSDGETYINFAAPLIEFTGVPDRYATHTTTLRPPKIPFEVLDQGWSLAINWPDYDIKTDSVWIMRSNRPQCRIIEGIFGYNYVPGAVKEAALLLAGMWGCKQAVWRDRFIQTMRSADWTVTYAQEGFGATTGSHAADLLLSAYVRKHMPEVI